MLLAAVAVVCVCRRKRREVPSQSVKMYMKHQRHGEVKYEEKDKLGALGGASGSRPRKRSTFGNMLAFRPSFAQANSSAYI